MGVRLPYAVQGQAYSPAFFILAQSFALRYNIQFPFYDREFNQYFEGYHRIYIENPITPDTQNTADHTGMKIWCHECSGGIFISSVMKTAIEDSNIEGVRTNPGFSLYGGTT